MRIMKIKKKDKALGENEYNKIIAQRQKNEGKRSYRLTPYE